MTDKRETEDAKMIRRAANILAEYARGQSMPPDVMFSIGVVIGAALRHLPPRESEDQSTLTRE